MYRPTKRTDIMKKNVQTKLQQLRNQAITSQKLHKIKGGNIGTQDVVDT